LEFHLRRNLIQRCRMLKVNHAHVSALLVDDEVLTIDVAVDHTNVVEPLECVRACRQIAHPSEFSIQPFEQYPHNPPTFPQMA
jgi:hypothetical protein